VTADLLDQRTLNRAVLERQQLLERRPVRTYDMIERLVGMQAQLPLDPYVGLWSRIDAFTTGELASLLLERRVVRAALMRSTIHLVSASDCLALRPLTQIVQERAYRGGFGKPVRHMDLTPVLDYGRKLLEEMPRTRTELRALLGERWPDEDANALAWGVTYIVPTVQVTPRGAWGETLQPTLTTVEAWLDRPLDPDPSIDDVVLRYLAAFGPATIKDVQAWCGLTRLREVVDRLGSRLRPFRSDGGAVLYDLPDAPRPSGDVPAPIRMLPVYDNVVLGHADRSRFMPHDPRVDGRAGKRRAESPPRLFAGPDANYGSALVDGRLRALWKTERTRDAVTLKIQLLERLSNAETSALEQEAHRLLTFVQPDAGSYDVKFVTGE
jgi:hypothetical protein